MLQQSISRIRFFACVIALIAASVCAANAATFSVDPILVSLQKSNSSTSVAITNQSAQRLRLQVTGYSWSQQPDGEMKLDPTSDLIFFPQLLTLDPGETRRVRVGVTAPQGAVEKTFRLFMEELPSLESVVSGTRNGITIRMKVGIPVFIAPAAAPVSAGEIRDPQMHDRALAFDVVNTGNTHFSVQRVHVTAKSSDGAPVFSRDLSGWYVLAGGTRHYSMELPKDQCSRIASIAIDVRAGSLNFAKSIDRPGRGCASDRGR
jgi:fimbrial chaperone protein